MEAIESSSERNYHVGWRKGRQMNLTDEDKAWFSERFKGIEARIEAGSERIEALLTAPYERASPVELRARTHAAVMRVMDVEIEALGKRARKPEPPPS
jgi:hypothetical protein